MNFHYFVDNQYFLFGTLLLIFSAIVGYLYQHFSQFVDIFVRYFVISATLDNTTSDAYYWLMRWVAQSNSVISAQRLKLFLRRISTISENEKHNTKIELIPGHGKHFLFYNGKMIYLKVTHRTHEMKTVGNNSQPFIHQSATLYTWGRDYKIFQHLLNEARDKCIEEIGTQEIGTKVYLQESKWREITLQPRRGLDSIILDDNCGEKIYQDVCKFFDRANWYKEMGIPYRRGYLLFGPTGTGKTALVSAIAGELNMGICPIFLTDPSCTDSQFSSLLQDAPKNSIILIEDIDSIFVDRNISQKGKKKFSRMTFSGLLNAIDGVASQGISDHD